MSSTSQNYDFVLLGGISLLRAFTKSRCRVLVVPLSDDDPVKHSRLAAGVAPFSFQAERAKGDKLLLESLRKLVTDHSEFPVLLYGDDATLEFVSRYRETLGTLFKLLLPPERVVESCLCKAKFSALAKSHELPCPVTILSSEESLYDRVRSDLGYPCLVKPFTHMDWHRDVSVNLVDGAPRKALVAASPEELQKIDVQMNDFARQYVVQSLIPGGEEHVYSYHALAVDEHTVLGECVGRKIRTWPAEMGESAFIELVDEPSVINLGRTIISRLGLLGPLKVDLKQHPETGEFVILEVNLRYSLWTHLIAAAGVSHPELVRHYLAGEQGALDLASSDRIRVGLAWLRFGADRRSWWRYYRPVTGMGLIAWLRSLRRPTVYPIFALTDPAPLIHILFARALRRGSRKSKRA